jgi:hypothetical protein
MELLDSVVVESKDEDEEEDDEDGDITVDDLFIVRLCL